MCGCLICPHMLARTSVIEKPQSSSRHKKLTFIDNGKMCQKVLNLINSRQLARFIDVCNKYSVSGETQNISKLTFLMTNKVEAVPMIDIWFFKLEYMKLPGWLSFYFHAFP